MAVSISEICENSKLAREMALMGNYDSAVVYYQGVVQEIQKLLHSIDDPSRKEKWQSVYRIFINVKIFSNINQKSKNLNIQRFIYLHSTLLRMCCALYVKINKKKFI